MCNTTSIPVFGNSRRRLTLLSRISLACVPPSVLALLLCYKLRNGMLESLRTSLDLARRINGVRVQDAARVETLRHLDKHLSHCRRQEVTEKLFQLVELHDLELYLSSQGLLPRLLDVQSRVCPRTLQVEDVGVDFERRWRHGLGGTGFADVSGRHLEAVSVHGVGRNWLLTIEIAKSDGDMTE